MNLRLNINQAIIHNEKLELITDMKMELSSLEPMGQMLVDSDQMAFIYLVAMNNEYAYVSIPHNTWTTLQEALSSDLPVDVVNEQSRLPLQGFSEEMNYLIGNIKGNSNYGEEMVGKVESIF